MTTMTYVDIQPMLDKMAAIKGRPIHIDGGCHFCSGCENAKMCVREKEICETLHVAPRTFRRWRIHGIPVERADGVAVILGYHPAELWGPYWWLDDEALEQEVV